MDPISHAVIGSAVAALVPHGTHPAAVWGALLGAELPDIDMVVRAWSGHAGYLKQHRSVTHGLLSLVVEAALVTAALRLIWPVADWRTVYAFTVLGCLSHVAFDCANDYGTKVFWPFSTRWMALDVIPLVDVWILGTIASGWGVNAVWAGHRPAIFGLVWAMLGAYVAVRLALRRKARDLVADQYQAQATIHPTLLSLTAWRYVVRTPGALLTGHVWPLRGEVGPATRAQQEGNQVVAASLKAQLVGAFAERARRSRVQVDRIEGLLRVQWVDAGYELAEEVMPYTVYAWLDENLRLVDEGVKPQRSAAGRPPAPPPARSGESGSP